VVNQSPSDLRRTLEAVVQTPQQAIRFICLLDPDFAVHLSRMLELLDSPTLEEKCDLLHRRLQSLKARRVRVDKARSPYKGRQLRRPTFQERRRRLLSKMQAAEERLKVEWGVHFYPLHFRKAAARAHA
jgi:hypothetical protein